MIHVEEKKGVKTTRGFSNECPFCSYRSDSATGLGDWSKRTPLPGDVSICINCAAVSFFTEGGLRKPTDAEKIEVMQDAGILAAQGAVRALPPRRRT